VAETNLGPAPAVTLDYLMLDPPEMRQLRVESGIRLDFLLQEVSNIGRFQAVFTVGHAH